MKNLGKHKVTEEQYLDGVFLVRQVRNKVVYQCVDGLYWVNWGRTKREAKKVADGYLLKVMAVTIYPSKIKR